MLGRPTRLEAVKDELRGDVLLQRNSQVVSALQRLDSKRVGIGVETRNAHEFGDIATALPPFEMQQQMDRIRVGQLDAGLENATGEPSQCLLSGVGVDSRKSARRNGRMTSKPMLPPQSSPRES